MPIKFEMPLLSPTMEKGNIVAWCKNEGDFIAIGDVILEIDTDKATMEVESIYEGILEKILVSAGSHDVPVKTPIAIIRLKDDSNESVDQVINETPSENIKDKIEDSQEKIYQSRVMSEIGKIKISPLAKRISNDHGIDVSKIVGTGPGGRIVKVDVLNNQSLPTRSFEKYIDEPISQMRRVIAEKLTKSKQETPHFYMQAVANVTDLLKIRKSINDSSIFDTKITVNDLFVKAVTIALKSEPTINVSWHNGQIRKFNQINISIAVAVDEGLMTPIIENADQKSLVDISKEIKHLVQLAKAGKLKPEQFIGGGITVSNLGMYGIDSFSSIINPPQASILSVGPAKTVPIYDENGALVPAQVITVGYAIDHRVIDGANAAKFLETLVKYLANPIYLII